MQSLLGQFYTRIKGSQEDIASEGLVYILSRSKSARETIRRIIKADCELDLPDLTYITQSSGAKLERPDITGSDDNGKERIIIEAKFWASLTDNQPVEYLNRLKENSVLVFVCPTLRVRPIYSEVVKRLNEASLPIIETSVEHTIYLGDNRFIIIKTWDEILGAVKLALSQENNPALLSDISQIIGFCNTIDNETFLPISSEDMSPSIARRINSYYDLIDKVTDELKKQGVAQTDGLRATGQKYGYTRFFHIRNFGIGLNVKFESWARDADTPFWLWISEKVDGEKHWRRTNEFKRACQEVAAQFGYSILVQSNNIVFFALFPLLNKTEDLVISDMSTQIIAIINHIERKLESDLPIASI